MNTKALRVAAFAFACMVSAALPAGAQTQSSSFTVFFDYKMVNLTLAADDVAKMAATSDAAKSATEVDIVGHTDTSESPAMKISALRAKSVARELRRFGLSKSVHVVMKGVGAKELMTPTGPRVREPMNRYVTITFH
ncbi:MAG: OmpA family protein [Alphaproteobacteria bacterium]|nr:OmpA family protein [Alphaproteobacteria bacterium]MDE2161868.1 OmpA family protein [Alphaproteobacteria bacterium]MDE2264939.1 OmpA family protein [Alphaproteobacteria bacterium]MDE2500318.1 OmpA family protein [Alphaproteobacteria bacterium]